MTCLVSTRKQCGDTVTLFHEVSPYWWGAKGLLLQHEEDVSIAIQQEPWRVLLVEDNPADARIIELSLRQIPLPVQLMRVEDGETALAVLRRQPPYVEVPRPGLILLDLHLPKTNGFAVLEEIYADAQLRTIPVVVCLGSPLDKGRLERYQLPADCIFTKGYDPDGLLRVLMHCPKAACKELLMRCRSCSL
jgi:two-component system, chemotaxis family, response regulator Rcp1